MLQHVDRLCFAGSSFILFSEVKLRELIRVAHKHGVYVSTGRWLEHVIVQGSNNAVGRYLQKCEDIE